MDKSYSIEVKCLFCDATLKSEDGQEYQSGDMIKCSECGELNDYDSVLEVAKEQGVELVKNELEKELKSKFKNLFK
jgi:phage FluMu protein Com